VRFGKIVVFLAGLAMVPAALGQLLARPAPDAVAEDASVLTEEQAVKAVVELGQRRGFVGMVVFGRELQAFSPPSWVTSAQVDAERLVVVHEKGKIEVRLDALPKYEVIEDTVLGMSQYGVPVGPEEVLWTIDGGLSSSVRRQNANRLADALNTLRSAGTGKVSEEARFADIVAQYQAASPKPILPEEVRKFQVQAEFALDNKRYADAARFYGEGIKLAPWWTAGRFNRALLLAETGSYRDAMAEMRRFLQLEPQSPDARLAQDRIYQWEAAAQLNRKPQ
jgi:tetratricopeptide (TPR) repeat protein